MSVINQVLNDLEKRGATAQSTDAIVRPVPLPDQRRVLWLLVVGSVLGLAAASVWWSSREQEAFAPPEPAPAPIQIISAQQDPASADMPAQLTMVSADTPTPIESIQPSMRLSFELSSIPLPSNLRTQAQTVKTKPNVRQKPVKKSAQPTKGKALTQPPPAPVTADPAKADVQIKQFSAQQVQENEFRRATALVQQGRSNEAYAAFEAVLKRDAGYDAARQAMVAILLDNKRNAEAEHLLQDGLQRNIKHSGFAMLLARLQVERGAVSQALETLNKTLPYADRQADYQAFVAALMQRQGKHPEAIEHYQIAVQLLPTSGVWLMGLGISLHAVQRNEEARAAFTRAIETGKLSAELRAFVEQQLKELG